MTSNKIAWEKWDDDLIEEELFEDLMYYGFLEDTQRFVYNPEYQRSYEWLHSSLEKIRGQTLHDHPHISLL